MILLLIIIFSIYARSKNKIIHEQRQINQIQDEYGEDIDNSYIKSLQGIKIDGSYSEDKKVNTPNIKTNMELIKYDEGSKTWIKDETNLEYSYEEQTRSTENGGTSKCANAKVTIDGVESYFVWLPRYAYKIDTTNKTIDIKFIKGTGEEAVDGTIYKYADDSSLDTTQDYIIHPAFTANEDLGGWSAELSGLWIGKYESARTDATNESAVSKTTIKVQPNVRSFRNATIGDMYNYGISYASNLQSHILKNSEWGAVAYLAYSQYGRNGTEVTINNNSNFITANAGDSISASESTETNAYNTEKGILASSTGNVYGIYDLSGGAYEYVTAYYNGSSTIENGSSFVSNGGTSTKYATAYGGPTVSSAFKYGDATCETSGWNYDTGEFVLSNRPFFSRAGGYKSESYAGIFYFVNFDGNYYSDGSFRMCLAVQ